MSKPVDIRKDPSFLSRVKKTEEQSFVRVLKEPVEITLGNHQKLMIAAIGTNGSYFYVDCRRLSGYTLIFGWSLKHSSAFETSEIAKCMAMWLITSEEDDYKKVLHRQFDPVAVAIDVIAKVEGVDRFPIDTPMVYINDQGITREVKNPFYTPNT